MAERIREYWPDERATRWLTIDENSGLKRLVDDELVCILKENGKYKFNQHSKYYYHDYNYGGMINRDVKEMVERQSVQKEDQNF